MTSASTSNADKFSEVPTRVVVHVDLDCFYCQVEQKRLGIPRETPCGVQQWNGLIAINYAARGAGVTRHMKVQEAKKVCPGLVAVHVEVLDEHGTVDEKLVEDALREGNHATEAGSSNKGKACLERYRKASGQIFRIFKACFPSATLEKASIDEAYLDLTDAVAAKLAKVNGAAEGLGSIFEEAAASSHVRGAQLDAQQAGDCRMAIGAHLTAQLRARVKAELGYTVSAGISHNKLLAKLASSMNKPDGQAVVLHRAVPAVMQDLPLKKIRNFGGKLGLLLQDMGCATAADVQQLSLQQLSAKCGDAKQAEWVMRAARGISDEPVTTKDIAKSMLAAKSFAPTSDFQQLERWLRVLCEELANRMATDSALHSRRPKNFVLHYRIEKAGKYSAGGPGESHSRSMQLPTGGADTPSADELVAFAAQMLRREACMPCNRVAVATTDFTPLAGHGKGIAGLFGKKAAQQPKQSAAAPARGPKETSARPAPPPASTQAPRPAIAAGTQRRNGSLATVAALLCSGAPAGSSERGLCGPAASAPCSVAPGRSPSSAVEAWLADADQPAPAVVTSRVSGVAKTSVGAGACLDPCTGHQQGQAVPTMPLRSVLSQHGAGGGRAAEQAARAPISTAEAAPDKQPESGVPAERSALARGACGSRGVVRQWGPAGEEHSWCGEGPPINEAELAGTAWTASLAQPQQLSDRASPSSVAGASAATRTHPWVISGPQHDAAAAQTHAEVSDLDSLALHDDAAAASLPPSAPRMQGAGRDDVDVDTIAAAEQRHILHLIQLRERQRAGGVGGKSAGAKVAAKRGSKGASQPRKKQRSINTLYGV